MLQDRINTGIELYENGVSDKILMSGDHTKKGYDEVNIMKDYAINKGIPSENVFMDHAGISTYDSIYRAKEIFLAEKILIVTQEYHLYRALHIAEKLGVEAYGVSADVRVYAGQELRELREKAARVKDFFKAILKPDSKIGGEAIPVSGNGDTTND
jgi:vancomycin permeability regulator SanA